MFYGAVPPMVQQMIVEVVEEWDSPGELWIGCSGNFTIERVLKAKWPEMKVHGNDVHLFQDKLAQYFMEKDPDLRMTDLGRQAFPWLQDSLETPEDQIATLMLASKLVQTIDIDGNARENPYYSRLIRGYQEQWGDLHSQTVEKLAGLAFRLESYASKDVYTWLKEDVPDEAAVIAYPPFTGAPMEYMPENPKLEKMFDWEAPTFEHLIGDRLETLFDMIAEREMWMFGLQKRRERFEPHLIGRHKPTNRGTLMHVYGSSSVRRLVAPHQQVQQLPIPHLQHDQELGEKVELREIDYSQFAQLRSMYMNENIRPGASSISVAVLADGFLIGCLAFSVGRSHPSNWAAQLPAPHAYMLSDFPVKGTRYERLAKLIAALGTSEEARFLCENYANRRYRAITTTAYSNHPASMKYRGAYKLLRRRDNNALNEWWAENSEISQSDPYYSRPFELEYGAVFGVRTAQAIYDEWRRKHMKVAQV